jgi:predicted permease
VVSAAQTTILPLSGSGWNERVIPAGAASPGGIANANRVSAAYFRTLGTPLLAGRDFDDGDTTTAPRVAIVNETFARTFFHSDALGRTFRFAVGPGERDETYHVVGLVRDTKYRELRESLTPIAFLAASQSTSADPEPEFVIRSDAALSALIPALKRSIAEVSPDNAVEFRRFRTIVREGLLRERLIATLSGFFASLAALLAAIGLYGLTSYLVVCRHAELGIRMALGANRRAIVRLILSESGRLLWIGLGAGLALALIASGATRALLFGIAPTDPIVIGLAALSLALVAIFSSLIPALRAARLDPADALRE